MVPNSVNVPSSHDYVFPKGCLFLSVEKATDWNLKGSGGDDQQRDKQTGERVWIVTVTDLHKEEGGFGNKSQEVKVKVMAPYQPVPPERQHPAFPPIIAFTDVELVPYVDSQKCTGPYERNGVRSQHKCRARLSWSVRASGFVGVDIHAGATV